MSPVVGIDLIHFAISDFYLDLITLAKVRKQDRRKFLTGIGQERMAVAPPDEDIITLAAKAAEPILAQGSRDQISAVIFATESGIDQSKSAGAFLHRLLELPHRCRLFEIKHACYAGAAALQTACNMVRVNPAEKVLVIASDVARYDLETPGEATQGCGAIAMLITADPSVMVVEPGSGYHSDDVRDFWRPNYRATAIVDGKYSIKVYLDCLRNAWQHFREITGRNLDSIDYFCYHAPFTKMASKAHHELLKLEESKSTEDQINSRIGLSQLYNRQIGNSFTASLFISLCSLLDHQSDLAGKRVGFFSFGSGCSCEFFSGLIQQHYESSLFKDSHEKQVRERRAVSYEEYLDYYNKAVIDQPDCEIPVYHAGPFRLTGTSGHHRQYVKTS